MKLNTEAAGRVFVQISAKRVCLGADSKSERSNASLIPLTSSEAPVLATWLTEAAGHAENPGAPELQEFLAPQQRIG